MGEITTSLSSPSSLLVGVPASLPCPSPLFALRLSRLETGRFFGLTSSSRLSCYHYNILALRCIAEDFRSDPLYLWATTSRRKEESFQSQVSSGLLFSKPLSSAAPHSARRFSTDSPGERMCRVLCALLIMTCALLCGILISWLDQNMKIVEPN